MAAVKTIASYSHLPPATEETPDPRPGNYYASAVDTGRPYVLVSGPYADHATALGFVSRARSLVEKHDPRAVWYRFGTCRLPEDSDGRPALQKWGYTLELQPVLETVAEIAKIAGIKTPRKSRTKKAT